MVSEFANVSSRFNRAKKHSFRKYAGIEPKKTALKTLPESRALGHSRWGRREDYNTIPRTRTARGRNPAQVLADRTSEVKPRLIKPSSDWFVGPDLIGSLGLSETKTYPSRRVSSVMR